MWKIRTDVIKKCLSRLSIIVWTLDPTSILMSSFSTPFLSLLVRWMLAAHQAGPITPYSLQRWDHFTALTRDRVFGLFRGGIKNRNTHPLCKMSPRTGNWEWISILSQSFDLFRGEEFLFCFTVVKHLSMASRRRGNKNSIQLCTFDNIV